MADWGWQFLSLSEKATILRGVRDGACYGGPFHAELQPTDICNLACFFCCTRRLRAEAEMPLATVRNLLEQLRELGAHSVTLSGGGEPLAHREIHGVLESIRSLDFAISNLTTNGTLLTTSISEDLLDAKCGQVIVSLNAGTPGDYVRMMGAPEEAFHDVTRGIRGLIAARQRRGTSGPRVVVQFLVWRQNFRSIPTMYELGISLGVDGILFNDVGGIPSALIVDREELDEEFALFRGVLEADRFEKRVVIQSHTRDISDALAVGPSPRRWLTPGVGGRLRAFRQRASWRSSQENLGLLWVASLGRRERARIEKLADCCLAPWHTITIRSNGDIPVCCALQDRKLGNVAVQSVRQAWHGETFTHLREQIRRTLVERERWQHDPLRDHDILPSCSSTCDTDSRCRFRSFFYSQDWLFRQKLAQVVSDVRLDP